MRHSMPTEANRVNGSGERRGANRESSVPLTHVTIVNNYYSEPPTQIQEDACLNQNFGPERIPPNEPRPSQPSTSSPSNHDLSSLRRQHSAQTLMPQYLRPKNHHGSRSPSSFGSSVVEVIDLNNAHFNWSSPPNAGDYANRTRQNTQKRTRKVFVDEPAPASPHHSPSQTTPKPPPAMKIPRTRNSTVSDANAMAACKRNAKSSTVAGLKPSTKRMRSKASLSTPFSTYTIEEDRQPRGSVQTERKTVRARKSVAEDTDTIGVFKPSADDSRKMPIGLEQTRKNKPQIRDRIEHWATLKFTTPSNRRSNMSWSNLPEELQLLPNMQVEFKSDATLRLTQRCNSLTARKLESLDIHHIYPAPMPIHFKIWAEGHGSLFFCAEAYEDYPPDQFVSLLRTCVPQAQESINTKLRNFQPIGLIDGDKVKVGDWLELKLTVTAYKRDFMDVMEDIRAEQGMKNWQDMKNWPDNGETESEVIDWLGIACPGLNGPNFKTLTRVLSAHNRMYKKLGHFLDANKAIKPALFAPLMPADSLGFQADPGDRSMRDILDSQIEYICESYGLSDMQQGTHSSNGLNDMQLGLLKVLRNIKQREVPVWDFDNVTARTISHDDPRKDLQGQLGLFATKDIPKHTFLGPFAGVFYKQMKFQDICEKGSEAYFEMRQKYSIHVDLIEKGDPEYSEKQKIMEDLLKWSRRVGQQTPVPPSNNARSRTELTVPENSLLDTYLELAAENTEALEKCQNELTVDTMFSGNRMMFINDYRNEPYAHFGECCGCPYVFGRCPKCCRKPAENDKSRINCEFEHVRLGTFRWPCFRTTKKVNRGEELLTDYGRKYFILDNLLVQKNNYEEMIEHLNTLPLDKSLRLVTSPLSRVKADRDSDSRRRHSEPTEPWFVHRDNSSRRTSVAADSNRTSHTHPHGYTRDYSESSYSRRPTQHHHSSYRYS